MLRVLAHAVVLAGLLTPSLVLAQPHASHSGFSGGAHFYRSAPGTGRQYWTPWQSGRSKYFGRNFTFPFRGRASFGIEPLYPIWWPLTDNGDQEAAPAPDEPSDDQLSNEIGNLAEQVQMLRAEQAQAGAQAAYSAEPAPPPEQPPATVLVYRDGRQVEVENYAIMGDTLFVFFGQHTERVPLSDLDLAATQRVNSERGVDFDSPTPK